MNRTIKAECTFLVKVTTYIDIDPFTLIADSKKVKEAIECALSRRFLGKRVEVEELTPPVVLNEPRMERI